MDDVSIHIDELIMEHPAVTSDHHIPDALRQPLADRLGVPVIAEIRRAVSAALDAGC
jgi:hypothetical protein